MVQGMMKFVRFYLSSLEKKDQILYLKKKKKVKLLVRNRKNLYANYISIWATAEGSCDGSTDLTRGPGG